jgi:hypothetical protein
MTRLSPLLFATLVLLACAWPLSAQWTNRDQRIGQGHHVYIEGSDIRPARWVRLSAPISRGTAGVLRAAREMLSSA